MTGSNPAYMLEAFSFFDLHSQGNTGTMIKNKICNFTAENETYEHPKNSLQFYSPIHPRNPGSNKANKAVWQTHTLPMHLACVDKQTTTHAEQVMLAISRTSVVHSNIHTGCLSLLKYTHTHVRLKPKTKMCLARHLLTKQSWLVRVLDRPLVGPGS